MSAVSAQTLNVKSKTARSGTAWSGEKVLPVLKIASSIWLIGETQADNYNALDEGQQECLQEQLAEQAPA